MILRDIRYLVTQNDKREVLEHVDLLIEGDEITGIGRRIPTGDHRVIDCSNKVVMPGLVNAHTHASMTLFRGIADNMELDRWLNEVIFPAEEELGPGDAYTGALVATAEMLLSGTTTFNDMYDHMHMVANAVQQSGIRAVLGRGLLDIDGKKDERVDDAIELVEEYRHHERIKPVIAPHAIYTASEQLLREAKDISRIFETPYHIHVAETRKEKEDSMDEREMTPLEYLDDLDLVSEGLIAAHGVWLTDEEKDLLEEKGGNVVHNPAANLKLGSGIADVPDMLERGINVAIGTDGVASNNNLNMFEEMKITSVLHKRDSPVHIDEQQVIDMATVNGAEALGMEDKIGSIEMGMKADLLTIDLNHPSMRPVQGKRGLISNLVYSFNGEVSDVIVDGRVRVREGELTGLKMDKVMEEADRRARRILEESG